ncbi:MAG: OsmC family protein [Rhodospirillaceae bacterium]|nr:OsmC family protein [Rhodospirillaceae bacterium]
MANSHVYKAQLAWTGAAQGPTSDYRSYARDYVVRMDGKPDLAGTADPLFLGDASRHNPEDLLIAALSACHLLSYLACAAKAGVLVVDYEDDAEGTMVFEKGSGHFVEAVLRPRTIVAKGTNLDLALDLHDQAHHVCFIAASMNFPVRHEAVVMEQPD